MKTPPTLESPESSSPIVTRAVAAALRGEYHDPFQLKGYQKTLLELMGVFPQQLAQFLLPRIQSMVGLPAEAVRGLQVETLARQRLQDYAGLPGKFPAITVGAAMGGASAHLALTLGGPFLPQAFVLTLQGGSRRANVQEYFERSHHLAQQITQANPDVISIQHFDPIHDGWLTRQVNHLRLKLTALPLVYQVFLRKHLQPGGSVVYLDCQARWLHFRTGARSVFQVGGWGDISPQEFIIGSERIAAFCRANGYETCGWKLDGFPSEEGYESEWGSEPGLGAALEAFCRQEGFRFVRIRLPEPHDYSRLAYRAVEALVKKDNLQPAGVLVETFTQFDPLAVRKGSLLPLWLIFNTRDSLRFFEGFRENLPKAKPVFVSPLATFSLTPDMAPWEDWWQALQGLHVTLSGARPSHYPADAMAVVRWPDKIRAWVEKHPQSIQSLLTPEELEVL